VKPLLEVKNLRKSYKNGVLAVDGIDLQIHAGSIYALVGPNGAGKTTTIKCILRLISCDSGEIDFKGKTITEDDIVQRISYVPEEKNLYEEFTVENMVNLSGRIISKFDLQRAFELVKSFKLPLAEKISSLSHGMKTQLYLSIAFAQNADIYILDEPTWGLDPIAQKTVLQMMCDLVGNGKGVFYTSHVLREVEKIADTVAIMHRGKILYSGTLTEAKEKFKTVVVTGDFSQRADLSSFHFFRKGGNFLILARDEEELSDILKQFPTSDVYEMDLEDIFEALVESETSRQGGERK